MYLLIGFDPAFSFNLPSFLPLHAEEHSSHLLACKSGLRLPFIILII
jgi:hypothetical protein